MFGFFEKKNNNPELLKEISSTQERWFVFLEKLEARMEEMTTAALPELQQVFNEDTDPYKRAHGNMLSGLIGQVNQMRHKANEVRENSVYPFMSALDFEYYSFRLACINRHNIFEEKINQCIDLLKSTTGEQDLETAYQEQLKAFENIRDKFNCKQCGGNIAISKMFMIATYVSCPYCQTQNTFMPSTAAIMVLHNARALAEQRTAHLLKIYEADNTKNPVLYQQYLRAMFDEWNKIVPDMAGENEKFYIRLLKDHSIYNY